MKMLYKIITAVAISGVISAPVLADTVKRPVKTVKSKPRPETARVAPTTPTETTPPNDPNDPNATEAERRRNHGGLISKPPPQTGDHIVPAETTPPAPPVAEIERNIPQKIIKHKPPPQQARTKRKPKP